MTDRIYLRLERNRSAAAASTRRRAWQRSTVAGNPSSVHAEGRAARRLIEEAREKSPRSVAAEPRNVVFTSGGTEANMLALTPASGPDGKAPDRLLISALEHPSVLAGGRFAAAAVQRVPATGDGRIDLAALADALAALEGRRALVSLMLANNETGVVQPVSEAARLTHEAGGVLHVDAVQAAGRIPCDINGLSAPIFSRFLGTRSARSRASARVVRRDAAVPFPAPLIKGGGQERGARAGTENVAGIAAFGAAAAAALADLARRSRAHGGAARPARGGPQVGFARPRGVRGRGRTAPQHHAVRPQRHEGGDRGHCLRSRRESPCRRARPAPRARSSPRMCSRPWEFRPSLRRAAVRVSLGPDHHAIRDRSYDPGLD